MANPGTSSTADPYLAELRTICLELPEASEVEAWGRPKVAVKRMITALDARADGGR